MITIAVKNLSLNHRLGKVRIFSGKQEVAIMGSKEDIIIIDVDENKKLWAKSFFCSSNAIEIDCDTEEVNLNSFFSNINGDLLISHLILFTVLNVFTRIPFMLLFSAIALIYTLSILTFGRTISIETAKENAISY